MHNFLFSTLNRALGEIRPDDQMPPTAMATPQKEIATGVAGGEFKGQENIGLLNTPKPAESLLQLLFGWFIRKRECYSFFSSRTRTSKATASGL